MNVFVKECKKFSRENWWIYAIFFLCLTLIFFTNTGNIFEIVAVFFLHWLGDIFMMMMGDYFAVGEVKQARRAQFVSSFIFSLVTLYGAIFQGKFNYLMSQILFMYPSLKAYLDEKGKKHIFSLYLFFLFACGIVFWTRWYGYLGSWTKVLQLVGFVILPFSVMLSEPKPRYLGTMLGIFLVFFGSLFETYYSFQVGVVHGIDISYTLLPLTVLFYYLKLFPKYYVCQKS